MRVGDELLKCVGFVGEQLGKDSRISSIDPYATGFFATVPSSTGAMQFIVFITAKHVAADLKGKKICFLVNEKDGGVTLLRDIDNRWWFHPTDITADVAVLACSHDPNLDYRGISTEDFLTPERMIERKIGIGDEVFSVGLFTFAPGTKRNMPIVRHGNVAMIPDEQIQTELGYADVYLVESRSIGGLSGSPVFVRQTVGLAGTLNDGTTESLNGLGRWFLLGLMHGHWDIKESEMNKPHFTHDPQRGVNLGISIVVPAYKILETVNRPELVAMREEYENSIRSSRAPGMDSIKNKV
jgi:hypothetical protein